MYRLSHQSGLEYRTRGASTSPYALTQPFYSLVTAPVYNDGMFIPSRDTIFLYSLNEKEKMLPYSLPQENYIFSLPRPEYHFIPDNFLKPGKEGLFVGKAEEVREFVEEAFEKIFKQPFPSNIKISILSQEEFRKIAPSPNTIGLSLNRSQEGLLSEIFILND